jgi:hypothetical protein
MDKMHATGLMKKNVTKGAGDEWGFWKVVIEKFPEYRMAVVETLRVYADAMGEEDMDIRDKDDSD